MLFWLLLTAILLVCLLALALTLLTLWRRVRALGHQLGEVGSTLEQAQREIDAAKAGGPLDAPPCPTCGAPAKAATKKRVAVSSQDAPATPSGVG